MKIFSQYKGLTKEVYMICLGRMVTAAGFSIFPLLTMILNTKLGYDEATTAYVMTIMALVQVPAILIAGKLTDKFGRRHIIILCDIISVIFFLACSLVPLGIPTIVCIVLASIAQSLEGPAYDSLIADFSLPVDRDRAFSLGYLTWNTGFIIGPALGGFLFNNHLSLLFIINGLSILFSTFLIYLYIFDKNAYQNQDIIYSEYEKGSSSESTLSVFKRNKVVLCMIIVAAFSSAVYASPMFILPLILPKLYGTVGSKIFGLIQSLNGLVVLVFTPLMTNLLKKKQDLAKVRLGVSIFTSAVLLFSFSEYPFIIYLAMAIFTIGEISNTLGESPYISRRIPATHRGRVITSLWIIRGTVGQLSNILMGNLMLTHSYKMVFYLYFGVGIITVILFGIIKHYDSLRYPNIYHEKETLE